jgi:hypothetical protein
MRACFEPLCHCPLDVANRGQVMGQQFGLAFDEIGTSQRRNTEVRLTHRWREQDSNPRSLSGTLPGPAHAGLPNAARTLCLGAVAQELPLHRVHLGDICRDVVVTAAFAGD